MENKTSKYFKYAIGEILLVVIGILIAVQINTWNQNRHRLQLEKVLLEQLKGEMLNTFDDIWGDLNILEFANKSHFRVLDYIEDDLSYADSMCFDFYWIKTDEYIYPTDAVYGRIKEEGLDIIRNDSIRNITQELYEYEFPRLSRSNSFNPDISGVLDEYYQNNFKPNKDYSFKVSYKHENDTISGEIFSNEIWNYPNESIVYGVMRKFTLGYVPLDFEALKKDTKFHMLLIQTEDFRDYKINRYADAKRTIKRLVNLIDKELGIEKLKD